MQKPGEKQRWGARCWPHGPMRRWRELLGSLPLVAHDRTGDGAGRPLVLRFFQDDNYIVNNYKQAT